MELPERFSYTTEGYNKAVEYLKIIGQYDDIIASGLSTDGYSIVHEANAIRQRNAEAIIKQQHMSEKSLGEQRVRTDFNVSGSTFVDDIKTRTAELINICETFKQKDARLASLAQTSFEEAAMWAVKAATA